MTLSRETRMKPSIASITTAYNAAHRLPRQIDALLRQTRALQEIVVVDNGSTDGTSAMLAERYPQVTVLRLSSNAGAAGGWAAGLTYTALEKRHDWIWNFDDDSVPGDSALDTMLSSAREITEDPSVGMLVPLPVHESTGVSYPPLLWRDGLIKPAKDVLQGPVWFADVAVASGCMVRREVVEAVGLPRADFFMDFFDFEYCLRMRSRKYKIAVINECPFSHELGDTVVIRFARRSRVWSQHAPWREYYMSRNLTYAAFWLYPASKTKQFAVLHLFRHAVAILLFGAQKAASLKKLLQGVVDGRRGRLGVRFLPHLGT
jgi:rhamnopyranosyl-N-acetylglucosaminyl-diphospho-decaprenol beta-1,3/1,4-galactofuranosyltransferase